MLAVWQEVVAVHDTHPRLSKCPACGGPAYVQWFNDDDCFAACVNERCSLSDADITKWTIFDKDKDAAKHWNEICRKIRNGKLCPECQSTLMDELEKGIFYCYRCRTITCRGKMLPKEKYIEFMTKYELPEPMCFDFCCLREA